jgi:mRNA-degrading endonuclease RelE of RelBE toxin-antitoxin system
LGLTGEYRGEFEDQFLKNERRYSSLRKLIQAHVDEILEDPYRDSEPLGWLPKGKDLRGCRSVRVTRGFRILFVICEECRRVPECRYCFCEGLPDQTVVFLTVGPHQQAYTVHERPVEYVAENQVRNTSHA